MLEQERISFKSEKYCDGKGVSYEVRSVSGLFIVNNYMINLIYNIGVSIRLAEIRERKCNLHSLAAISTQEPQITCCRDETARLN